MCTLSAGHLICFDRAPPYHLIGFPTFMDLLSANRRLRKNVRTCA